MTSETERLREVPLVEAFNQALGSRYEFSSRLGAGAFGEVYCLWDTLLEREVAVKRVRMDIFTEPAQQNELRERTVREAKVAAKLKHPHIVTVFDVVDRPDMSFIIMEYIEGRTLARVLKDEGRLSLDETISILGQAASALDFAHRKGVVHRDVKPANIMIEASSGVVKVMDFGIAKSDGFSELTAAGSVLGTPNYMSPEQARGESTIDFRTDLFSFGCDVYECLVGQKAFAGSSAVTTMLAIVNEPPRAFDNEALGLHSNIADILQRALAKDPNERFSSASELIEALRSLPQVDPATIVLDVPAPPAAPPVVTRREPGNTSSFDARMQGSLADTSVGELIRDVYSSRNTGILHFERDGVSKRIYFKKGNIVFANSDVNDDRLGEFLIRIGQIDRTIFVRASELMRRSNQRMGTALIELGVMSRGQLEEFVRRQVGEIVNSVFQWEGGAYGFEFLDQPVEEDILLELSTAELILIGVRQMSSPNQIRRSLGALDRILQHTENPLLLYQKMTLTPSEGYVLSRIDGATSISEIIAISPLGEETLRCVYALVAAGVVVLSSKTSTPTSRLTANAREEHPPPDLRSEKTPEAHTSSPSEHEGESRSKEPSEQERAILDDIVSKHAALATADYYELLEVSPGASDVEIKKAYYAMARKYHPDRHHLPHLRDVEGLLEELFAMITVAYQELSDPGARRRYDGARQQKARVASESNNAPNVQATVPYTVPPEVIAERHYQQGFKHFEHKQYFDAIQCLRESVRMVPVEPRYRKLLARALSKNPKWRKEAEAHFVEALKADEFDIQCLLALAENYEAANLWIRAARVYDRVLTFDPDNVVARERLQRESNAKRKKPSR